MKFKLRGFKIGYRTKILHEINNGTVNHRIIYELVEGDNVKVTENPVEYQDFLERKFSREIIVRIRVLASQLKSNGYLLIPKSDGRGYYIVKVIADKKGKVKDFEIIEKLPDLREQKSSFIEEKNGNGIIVGYVEEMFIKDSVVGERLKDEELEEAKKEVYEILKNVKVNVQ